MSQLGPVSSVIHRVEDGVASLFGLAPNPEADAYQEADRAKRERRQRRKSDGAKDGSRGASATPPNQTGGGLDVTVMAQMMAQQREMQQQQQQQLEQMRQLQQQEAEVAQVQHETQVQQLLQQATGTGNADSTSPTPKLNRQLTRQLTQMMQAQRPPAVQTHGSEENELQAQLEAIKAAHVNAEQESPFLWENGAPPSAQSAGSGASGMWGKVRSLARSPTMGQSALGEAVNAHVLRERMAVVEMDAMLAREELMREKAGKDDEVTASRHSRMITLGTSPSPGSSPSTVISIAALRWRRSRHASTVARKT